MTLVRTDLDDREEERFRSEVRSWLDEHLIARRSASKSVFHGAGGDSAEAIEQGREFLRLLATRGWARPTWPVEYGGAGLSPDHAAVLARELLHYETPDLYLFGVALEQSGTAILRFGTPEQQARWLPSINDGSRIWTLLFSEPGAGSDLAGLTTRAIRDGDGWLVTGQKVWSSRAHLAAHGLLLARTDGSAPKHAGITAFCIDMDAPGVEVRPLRQMNGDDHFNEVFLDDVFVPDRDRLGELSAGWNIATAVLMGERNKPAHSGNTGELAGALKLIELVQARGLDADPVLRQKVASLYIEAKVADWTMARAQQVAAARGSAGPEGSGAKVRKSAIQKRLAQLALEVLGPEGAVEGSYWNTMFLTTPSISIRGGTDEIQRNIIGERVLGLPSEPRSDRGVPFRELRTN